MDRTNFIYELEHQCIKVFGRMEMLGVGLDTDRLHDALERAQKAMVVAQGLVNASAGREVKLESTADVRRLLYDELGLPKKHASKKTGVPSTDNGALELLKTHHPIIEHIQRWRKFEKLAGGFLGALPKHVQRDGCLHTSFNQILNTGRVSSSDPNLQNAPKYRGEGAPDEDDLGGKLSAAIRASFVPPPNRGFVGFFDCDYSQIEYRLFASMGADQGLLDAFYRDVDVHTQTAAIMFGVPLEQVTKQLRQRGKTLNFAAIYGQGPKALAALLGITEQQARDVQRQYWLKMPQAAAYCEALREFARKHEYCETYFGRRRPTPDINSYNTYLRGTAERIAVNTPVQGSAADIIKIAMLRLDQMLTDRGFKSRLCLTVHDELVTAYHEDDDLDALAELKREAMELVIPGWCPLITEPAYGANWGEVEDFVYPSRREGASTVGTALATVTPTPDIQVAAPKDRIVIALPANATDEDFARLERAAASRPGPVALDLVLGDQTAETGRFIAVDRQLLMQLRAEGFSYEVSESVSKRLMRA